MKPGLTRVALMMCIVASACQPDKSASAVDGAPVITIHWQVDAGNDTESQSIDSGHFSRVIRLTEHGVSQANSAAQSNTSYTFTLKKSWDELDQIQLLDDANTLLTDVFYQPSLVGLCVNKHNLSPVFFIHSVDEGIGITYQELWLLDPQQQWRAIALPDSDSFMANNVVCADQQYSDWADYLRHANSEPCRCNFNQDIFGPTEQERWQALLPEHVNIAEPFTDDFVENQIMPLTLHLIDNQEAINLMIEQAMLAPEYESSVVTDADITFVNLVKVAGVYQNIGYSFIQQDGLWYLWTIAGDSSKAFHPITEIQQHSDGLIHMQMCVADCKWWGKQALVAVDLQGLNIKMLEQR